MTTLPEQILTIVGRKPGMTDREITSVLRGASAPQQPINQAARNLEQKGLLVRRKRLDGLIGNYPTEIKIPLGSQPALGQKASGIIGPSEDKVKEALKTWLQAAGWKTDISWGKGRGADIVATRGQERWVIEAKGIGSRPEMRVNYFVAILGEALQRMDDPNAKYSIALPDAQQFRTLWQRLPILQEKEQVSRPYLWIAMDR